MARSDDLEYYIRRWKEENEAAGKGGLPSVVDVHRVLAAHYNKLISDIAISELPLHYG